MLKWYSIGAVTFPASWAAIAAAFAAVVIYLKIRREKQAADVYGNAFFIFIVTWKLSFVLFQWKMSIKNPLSILYFNGGIKGYWLGVAAVMLYLWRERKKSRIQGDGLPIEIWVYLVAVYEILFYLLNNGHILLSGIQFTIGIFFLLWIRKKLKDPVWTRQLLILYTCFQGLFYSFQGGILSTPMLTYIAGMIFFIWINSTRKEGAG